MAMAIGARRVQTSRRIATQRGTKGRRQTNTFAASQSPEWRKHIPRDIFYGTAPEEKAAERLALLLTQETVRLIIEQGMGQRWRSPISKDLTTYVLHNPVNHDSKQWLEDMLSSEDSNTRQTAMRVMETREHLVGEKFKWKDLQDRLLNDIENDNAQLLTGTCASTYRYCLFSSSNLLLLTSCGNFSK